MKNRQHYQIFQWTALIITIRAEWVSISEIRGREIGLCLLIHPYRLLRVEVWAVTAREDPCKALLSPPKRGATVSSNTGRKKSSEWTRTMWGTLAARIWQKIGLGTTEDSFLKSKWIRYLTTKGALMRFITLRLNVPQKQNKFLRLKNSRGRPVAVAISVPLANIATKMK